MDKTRLMEKTILVVEDEKLSRTIIVATLEAYGFRCEEAENGQYALNKLEQLECDLILTDLRMPVINGLDLIKEIRGGEIPLKTDRNVPVVVLSAEEGEMVDKAQDLGVSGSFIKKEPIGKIIPKLLDLLGLNT